MSQLEANIDMGPIRVTIHYTYHKGHKGNYYIAPTHPYISLDCIYFGHINIITALTDEQLDYIESETLRFHKE